MSDSGHFAQSRTVAGPLVVVVLGIVSAFTMVIARSHELSYDEPWYQSSVHEIDAKGLTSEWIRTLPGPAGPTYAVTHYAIRGLTKGSAVGIRVATLTMLVLSMALMWGVGNAIGLGDNRQWAVLLAVPPTVLSAGGMALTEVPALLWQCLALCLLWTVSGLRSFAGYCLIMCLSGLCFSAAILGRQPLLATVPIYTGLCFYAGHKEGKRRALIGSVLAVICALAPAAYVFAIWRGLVPPLTADVGKGFRVDHAITALGYAGLFHTLIDPSILRLRRAALIVFAVAVGVFCALVSSLRVAPLRSTLEKLMPASGMDVYAFVVTVLLIGLGVTYVLALLLRVRGLRTAWIEGLAAIAVLILCASAGGITHLTSSRYVVNTVPFMMLVSLSRPSSLSVRTAASALGVAGGLLALHGYLR